MPARTVTRIAGADAANTNCRQASATSPEVGNVYAIVYGSALSAINSVSAPVAPRLSEKR